MGVLFFQKRLVPVLNRINTYQVPHIEESGTVIEFGVPGHTAVVCDAISLILGQARLLVYLVRQYMRGCVLLQFSITVATFLASSKTRA